MLDGQRLEATHDITLWSIAGFCRFRVMDQPLPLDVAVAQVHRRMQRHVPLRCVQNWKHDLLSLPVAHGNLLFRCLLEQRLSQVPADFVHPVEWDCRNAFLDPDRVIDVLRRDLDRLVFLDLGPELFEGLPGVEACDERFLKSNFASFRILETIFDFFQERVEARRTDSFLEIGRLALAELEQVSELALLAGE